MEFVHFLETYKDVFSELFSLCKIAVVLPVSSTTYEKSFFSSEDSEKSPKVNNGEE